MGVGRGFGCRLRSRNTEGNSRCVGHGHFSTCRREGALGEYAHGVLREQTWPWVNAAGVSLVSLVGCARCQDRKRSRQADTPPVTRPGYSAFYPSWPPGGPRPADASGS